MLNIIGHRKSFFVFSSIVIVLALAATAKWGLRFSIDFTGGSISGIFFDSMPETKMIDESLQGLDLGKTAITPSGDKEIFIRTEKTIDEETHQKMLSAIRKKFPDAAGRSFTSRGKSISDEFKQKAVLAVLAGIMGIGAYVSWAFRKVSRPISSWKYGIVTIGTLFHDVIIPIGVFALLGYYKNAEIDLAFIAAILTIAGYSVHDTIVVFDRTRENLIKHNINDFEEMVNRSVNQTLVRSLNTSLTVIIVLFMIYLFGAESLRYFALALIIGVATGTYSSIFIASPLLVEWQKRSAR